MKQLIKYEFRKTAFSKLILLVVTAIAEILFLVGVFLNNDSAALALGVSGLMICAIVGLFFIGIESLLAFHQDLNTKQSYMLFMTPHTSYEILGAKVLQNAMSIFLTGCAFAALAAVDITIAILYIGGLKEFLDMLQQFLNFVQVNIVIMDNWTYALLGFFASLAGWLMMIVNGYLAIVISSTFFAGKKLNGLFSFLIYILISFLCGRILGLFPDTLDWMVLLSLNIAGSLVLSVIFYFVTGWIMENKLSV